MSDGEAQTRPRAADALLRDTQGVTVDPAEAEAALAVARAAGAAAAGAADRLMTLDETPWSFDTLRALCAGDER